MRVRSDGNDQLQRSVQRYAGALMLALTSTQRYRTNDAQ